MCEVVGIASYRAYQDEANVVDNDDSRTLADEVIEGFDRCGWHNWKG